MGLEEQRQVLRGEGVTGATAPPPGRRRRPPRRRQLRPQLRLALLPQLRPQLALSLRRPPPPPVVASPPPVAAPPCRPGTWPAGWRVPLGCFDCPPWPVALRASAGNRGTPPTRR